MRKRIFHRFSCCFDCCVDLLNLNEASERISLCVCHVQTHNVHVFKFSANLLQIFSDRVSVLKLIDIDRHFVLSLVLWQNPNPWTGVAVLTRPLGPSARVAPQSSTAIMDGTLGATPATSTRKKPTTTQMCESTSSRLVWNVLILLFELEAHSHQRYKKKCKHWCKTCGLS